MDLTGTVALITGGKRIGRVVARDLGLRGVNVAMSYARSRAEAELAVQDVRANGGRRAEAFQADLSDPAACAGLVRTVAETFGRLDILITMASVYMKRPFDDLSVSEWNATIDVDLRAAFLCAHAAVPYMRRQGGGRIINFSDWIAKSGGR